MPDGKHAVGKVEGTDHDKPSTSQQNLSANSGAKSGTTSARTDHSAQHSAGAGHDDH